MRCLCCRSRSKGSLVAYRLGICLSKKRTFCLLQTTNTRIKSCENPTQRVTTIEDTAADTSSKGPLASFQASETPTPLCPVLPCLPARLSVLGRTHIIHYRPRTNEDIFSRRVVPCHTISHRITSHLALASNPEHFIQNVAGG